MKADFAKPERYLYEFFNHKDYYKFKESYIEHLQTFDVGSPRNNNRKVSIGVHDPNQKVQISLPRLCLIIFYTGFVHGNR